LTVAISLLLQDIFLFSGDVASNIRLGNRIDSHTEQMLQRAMNRVMADRTSIIIAHRLSTIKTVNKIVAMHKALFARRDPTSNSCSSVDCTTSFINFNTKTSQAWLR
jgi:ABC-type multidrug transport system fused ATPase/permease subunit